MSELPKLLSLRSTLAGRWQIPLLVAGSLVFAGGLADMFWKHKPVSFADELNFVRQLREAKAHERASAYLMNQMQKPKRPEAERAELARLLAQVIYDVESSLSEHRKDNVRAILSNYRTAKKHGAELTGEDWVAMGDAYAWSKNEPEAADAYRQALRESTCSADRLRRALVEMQLASPKDHGALNAASVALLDEILESDSASPATYAWALELSVDHMIERAEAPKALARIEEARARLSGTEERIGLGYLEALCRRQMGQRAEAEALLRTLRDEWTARDELWGRAGWLLGRLQQDDDRPQAALAFYEETLQSFRTGEIAALCQLGRAECLASLGRHESAYAEFVSLFDLPAEANGRRSVDPTALRSTVGSIGDALLSARSLELGIKYLELALKHTDAASRASRLLFTSRLASALAQQARDAKEPARKRELLTRSAEMQLALSQMQDTDEEASVRALEQAVTEFDAAGLPKRGIEVLDRYVATKVDGLWRPTALYRLGQAYQAEHRFADAISAYQDVIQTYPRMPDALRSMVPLAECLLIAGSEKKEGAAALRARGVELLKSIVEDRGKEQLFGPSASEYREAYYQLAEYESRASDSDMPDHFERAIARWEGWLALYPDDSRLPQARFMLADAYRHSAGLVAAEGSSQPSEAGQATYHQAAVQRLNKAQENYELVIGVLAATDASQLTPRDEHHLRASYLYRADCLFDLGRYKDALTAYSEAAWRYENLPTAVSACIQIAHCQQRLGKPTEASAALARVRWLLAKIPASSFAAEHGQPSKQEWQALVERIEKAGLY